MPELNILGDCRHVDTYPVSLQPGVWLAYRCSTRHYYDGESSTQHEYILDADTNPHELAKRVNAYFARPDQIRSERGKQHIIPAFASESKPLHGSGGGCDYDAWLEIRKAPRLAIIEG